jgi:hypothetical protein
MAMLPAAGKVTEVHAPADRHDAGVKLARPLLPDENQLKQCLDQSREDGFYQRLVVLSIALDSSVPATRFAASASCTRSGPGISGRSFVEPGDCSRRFSPRCSRPTAQIVRRFSSRLRIWLDEQLERV